MEASASTLHGSDARTAWDKLVTLPGEPCWLDVPILVKPVRLEEKRKIVLEASTEAGESLGRCWVYTNEWYPGCLATNPFSHYFNVLWYVLQARTLRNEHGPLRLQVLKAVAVETRPGSTMVVLLKFIVAPEYTVTGSHLERVYTCPLQVFFEHFVGLSRDYREEPPRTSDVRGRAIHAGYRRALTTYAATGDGERAHAAFRSGATAEWERALAALAASAASAPTRPKELEETFAAASAILQQITQYRTDSTETVDLYLERLLYSVTRGLSGRADRVEIPLSPESAPLRVAEVKTRGIQQERDPLTGNAAPGGLQALAYRELLLSHGFPAVDGLIEVVEGTTIHVIPLALHPLVRRLRLDLSQRDERAIDLIAQARNVFYCVASGLFTGYDRYQLDAATRNWRLPAISGQFDLLSPAPPCAPCSARQRRVCPESRYREGRELDGLFRYAPAPLYSYWVWFHRQLKAEERAARELLFALVTSDPEQLERQGITLSGLRLERQDDRRATFVRPERRLDTRIREEDTVLVTPQWPDGFIGRQPLPGHLFSVEGRVLEVGEHRLVVELRDRVPLSDTHEPLFRVDLLSGFDMRNWQLEGLADFLVSSMAAAPARGRALHWRELPPLTQTILGLRRPATLRVDAQVPRWAVQGLNVSQQRALAAAALLPLGELLLIQGPPGTGKTALIAAIVRWFVIQGLLDPARPPHRRPVLVLTNTHRAANEVVLKVRQRAPEILPFLVRVGGEREDMEPEVAEQTLLARARVTRPDGPFEADEQAIAYLLSTSRSVRLVRDHAAVFVATLGAADTPELRGLTFETVIVDEAAQATEPAFLQALRRLPAAYRGRLILVGDQNQLPPVVTQLEPPALWNDLRRLGFQDGDSLRTSAFERLHRRYPEACVRLTEQYRMNAPICHLVSQVFYEGTLHPADERIADRRLANWLSEHRIARPSGLLGESPPILFLDTSDDPLARDSGARLAAPDEGRTNEREAELIAVLLAEFVRQIPEEARPKVIAEIGVISPYRRQNTLLRQRLAVAHPALRDVRVDTVDRFQGGQKEMILVSLVDSNTEGTISQLHIDWRRLNVAISRARCLLVLVGDRRTFTLERGDTEEAEARRRFRQLFATIDELARLGQARIVPTAPLRRTDTPHGD